MFGKWSKSRRRMMWQSQYEFADCQQLRLILCSTRAYGRLSRPQEEATELRTKPFGCRSHNGDIVEEKVLAALFWREILHVWCRYFGFYSGSNVAPGTLEDTFLKFVDNLGFYEVNFSKIRCDGWLQHCWKFWRYDSLHRGLQHLTLFSEHSMNILSNLTGFKGY